LLDEARATVAGVEANGDVLNPLVIATVKEIVDTLQWEKEEGRSFTPKQIIKNRSTLRRLLIGISPGPFATVSGVLIAAYYFGAELATAGVTDPVDQLRAVGVCG
jgi:hypothetical protein